MTYLSVAVQLYYEKKERDKEKDKEREKLEKKLTEVRG